MQLSVLQLVPADIYEQHLAKSVAQAENKIGNAFHCKTPDCRGWCIFEDNVNEFRCPVCRRTNCLTCQVSLQFCHSYVLIAAKCSLHRHGVAFSRTK